MATVTAPINGLEITPRLWLGDNSTCDACRRDLSFTCVNVGMVSHTSDPRCNFIPICASASTPVSSGQSAKVQQQLINAFANPNQKALLHCHDGKTYSALAMVLWLQLRYQITVPQAYQWILAKQPKTNVLTNLLPPKLP